MSCKCPQTLDRVGVSDGWTASVVAHDDARSPSRLFEFDIQLLAGAALLDGRLQGAAQQEFEPRNIMPARLFYCRRSPDRRTNGRREPRPRARTTSDR